MAKGSITIHVTQPPEVVFAFVSDLEKAPEWVPDLVSVTKITDGSVGIGTKYSEVVRMGNEEGDAKLEVTEFDPPRVYAHKGKGGPSNFLARFVMEPDATGTTLTHEYEVRITGFFKLFSPVVGNWVRKNTESAMANLQQRLDSVT